MSLETLPAGRTVEASLVEIVASRGGRVVAALMGSFDGDALTNWNGALASLASAGVGSHQLPRVGLLLLLDRGSLLLANALLVEGPLSLLHKRPGQRLMAKCARKALLVPRLVHGLDGMRSTLSTSCAHLEIPH